MTYNEKKKLCKEINNHRIYKAISHGIVCACYRNVNGIERLEVSHHESPFRLLSESCIRWTDSEIISWIIYSTIQLLGWISQYGDTSEDSFDLKDTENLF